MSLPHNFLRLLRSRTPLIRSFTRTSPFFKGVPAPPKNKKSPPKIVPSRTSQASARASAGPAAKGVLSEVASWTKLSEAEKYAESLLGRAKSVMLYTAPSHNALFISSMVVGGGLFVWAGSVANAAFMSTTVWYAKFFILGGCLAVSAIATGIAMTPLNLVKTISIARNAEQRAVVRVQGTRFFPFLKPKTMDLVPGEALVDSDIRTSIETIQCYIVSLQNRHAWTEHALSPDYHKATTREVLTHTWHNAFPKTKLYVNKMFNRDGFAYLRAGGNNWKMNLDYCAILERGQVLMKLVKEGGVRTNAVGMIARAIWNA